MLHFEMIYHSMILILDGCSKYVALVWRFFSLSSNLMTVSNCRSVKQMLYKIKLSFDLKMLGLYSKLPSNISTMDALFSRSSLAEIIIMYYISSFVLNEKGLVTI